MSSNNLTKDAAPAALVPASTSVVAASPAPAPAPAPAPVVADFAAAVAAAGQQPVLPGYGAYPIDGLLVPVLPPATSPSEPKTESKRAVIDNRRCGKCHKTDRVCSKAGNITCIYDACEGCNQCFYDEKTKKRKLIRYRDLLRRAKAEEQRKKGEKQKKNKKKKKK